MSYVYREMLRKAFGVTVILVGILCIAAYAYKSRLSNRESFQTMGNVHIFYHIYCNPVTKSIVKDQTMKILFSGTYARVNTIQCFLTGAPEHIATIRDYLSHLGDKYTIVAEGPNDTTYERFTLEKMHGIVQPTDKILYIHSKGTTYTSETDLDNVFWWRTWMEYNLLFKSAECLANLDSYDIVGTGTPNGGGGFVCMKDKDLKPLSTHFAGNFWWSTGKYFLSLPKKVESGYCDPESYIFSGNPKYMSLDADKAAKDTDYYRVHIYPNIFLK
jgi:hypothetical protein